VLVVWIIIGVIRAMRGGGGGGMVAAAAAGS